MSWPVKRQGSRWAGDRSVRLARSLGVVSCNWRTKASPSTPTKAVMASSFRSVRIFRSVKSYKGAPLQKWPKWARTGLRSVKVCKGTPLQKNFLGRMPRRAVLAPSTLVGCQEPLGPASGPIGEALVATLSVKKASASCYGVGAIRKVADGGRKVVRTG